MRSNFPRARVSGNRRTGRRRNGWGSEIGDLDLATPRDRNASSNRIVLVAALNVGTQQLLLAGPASTNCPTLALTRTDLNAPTDPERSC
jgi:hypothetical protein